MRTRYLWVPLLILAIAIPLGFYYVDWSKSGEGAGLYSRNWSPEAIFAYWNPDDFYESVDSVIGEFTGEQCVDCHTTVTPGVVNDWRKSRHSNPANDQAVVYCSDCHGNTILIQEQNRSAVCLAVFSTHMRPGPSIFWIKTPAEQAFAADL